MPWKFISKLEIHDRQVHASPDGTEVINTYYVEPASGGCVVISALLGAVLYDGGLDDSGAPKNPTQGHRILPAFDYQYNNCYCVDAYETMIHPEQPIGTASLLGSDIEIGTDDEFDAIRTMVSRPIVLNGPQSLNDNLTKNSIDPTLGPRPGVYIRAVFRPLITNYKYGNDVDAGYPLDDQDTFSFDYLDIRINPMSRIIPASAALYGVANTGFGFGIAAQGAAEQIDSWLQLTIRRVMCPNIPLQTIAVLKNKINGDRGQTGDQIPINIGYTPACFEVPGLDISVPILVPKPGEPTGWIIDGLTDTPQTFPYQTLRFDDVVWEKKVIQSCIDQNASDVNNIVILQGIDGVPYTKPMTWYNGELMFSWRTVMDNWYPTTFRPNDSVYFPNPFLNPPDYIGHRKANYGWVTWNCDWLPGGMGIDISKIHGASAWDAILASVGAAGGILAKIIPAIVRYPSGWYELASWQGMGFHGNLPAYNFTKIEINLPAVGKIHPLANLGILYLQTKYWDDTDIRLRGGNGSGWNPVINNWNTPGVVTPGSDMLALLEDQRLIGKATPFDLLFRVDAP